MSVAYYSTDVQKQLKKNHIPIDIAPLQSPHTQLAALSRHLNHYMNGSSGWYHEKNAASVNYPVNVLMQHLLEAVISVFQTLGPAIFEHWH